MWIANGTYVTLFKVSYALEYFAHDVIFEFEFFSAFTFRNCQPN